MLPTLRIPLALLMAATGGLAGAQMLPGGGVGGAIGNATGGLGTGVGDPLGSTIGGLGRQLGDIVDGNFDLRDPANAAEVGQATAPDLSRISPPKFVQTASSATLAELRKLRLATLVKSHQRELEMDGAGNPARRGQLVLLDPTAEQIRASAALGFAATADMKEPALGMRMVTLAIPTGTSIERARSVLRKAVPGAAIEYNHIYEPAGGGLAALTGAGLATSATSAGGPVIGMVDGGVASAPALSRAGIEQRGFSGAARPTGHGTAVASLMVGSDGRFGGAARGAKLAVADVYGGSSAAGSATSIVSALSWLASKRPAAINISLVGPRNRLVERAISLLMARGVRIVAAVGNDGPAAPALYPASQAGVIAVTAVDKSNRALPEAGRNTNLAYAAPGADMVAALPGNGYGRVRGTSFATPYVTSRLVIAGSTRALDEEARKGRGRVGKGVVCSTCRVEPKAVGLK